MSLSRRIASLAFAALALSCSERPAEPAAAVQRYAVRGELVRVDRSGDAPQLWIRHEAIPDFADRNGTRVGMSAMVMPFDVDARVPLAGLSPGMKVRFRVAVDWGHNRLAIEALEPLPADTALDLGAPR